MGSRKNRFIFLGWSDCAVYLMWTESRLTLRKIYFLEHTRKFWDTLLGQPQKNRFPWAVSKKGMYLSIYQSLHGICSLWITYLSGEIRMFCYPCELIQSRQWSKFYRECRYAFTVVFWSWTSWKISNLRWYHRKIDCHNIRVSQVKLFA